MNRPIHTHEQRKLLLAGIKLLGMIQEKQIDIACIHAWRGNLFFGQMDEIKIAIVEAQLERLIDLYNSLAYRLLEKPLPNREKVVTK